LNKISFFGGFAAEKTPLRRAKRVCAPRGASQNQRFLLAAISTRIPHRADLNSKTQFYNWLFVPDLALLYNKNYKRD
jgi:hypothetical protein